MCKIVKGKKKSTKFQKKKKKLYRIALAKFGPKTATE